MAGTRAGDEKGELCRRLEQTRSELLEAIGGLTEEQMRRRPGPGRWSVAEVLAHLPVWERQVLRQADSLRQRTCRTVVLPSQADREAAADRGRRLPPPAIVHDLVASRWDTLRFLERLTPGDLNRRGRGQQQGSVGLRGVLATIADYEEEQASQIHRLRGDLGLPVSGARHSPL